MKRLVLLITITFIFVFSLFSCASTGEPLIKFLGNKNLTAFLEVAITDEEKNKGLMGRPSLAENRGMVFVFKPARQVTFWMKDTLIPLDMIFIRNNKIVKIIKNAMPNQTETLYPSDFEVSEVVEVNGGYAEKNMIVVGSKVSFKNIPQIKSSTNKKS